MELRFKRRQRDALPSRLDRTRAQRRRSQQHASLNTRPNARPRPVTSTGRTANQVTRQDQIGESESSARAAGSTAAPVATDGVYIPAWFPDSPPGYENDQKQWAVRLAMRATCNGIIYDSALTKKLYAFSDLAHWKARVVEKELAATKSSDAEDRVARAEDREAATADAVKKAEENVAKRKQAQADAGRDFIAVIDAILEEPSSMDKQRTGMLRKEYTAAVSDLASARSGLEEAYDKHYAAQKAVSDTKMEAITAAGVSDIAKQTAAGAAITTTGATAAAGIADTSGASSADILSAIVRAKAAIDQHIDGYV